MKTIYEHSIGGDGAVAGLYVDGDFVIEQVKYPLAKALDPADKFIDSAIDGLEAKIPGDWDKALLEPARVAAHAELQKLVGG
jgi:hypothetical protein